MADGGRLRLRSKLAQSVYDRMLTDENLRNMDFSTMYSVKTFLLSSAVSAIYIPMEMDVESKAFIDDCFDQSDYMLLQVWHSMAKSFLGLFMSQTSVNGLLNRGRMFVWSREQAKLLLQDNVPKLQNSFRVCETSSSRPRTSLNVQREVEASGSQPPGHLISDLPKNVLIANKDEDIFVDASEDVCLSSKSSFHSQDFLSELQDTKDASAMPVPPPCDEGNLALSTATDEPPWWSGKVVLDLGAGDGHVTRIVADSATDVYATETSPVMRKRLSYRGYKLLGAFTWVQESEGISFDLITCLNLLDRCDKPVSLLRDIHAKLATDGKLVIALVLPISPYVETGSDDHTPSEILGITGDTIEEQVNCSVEEVFPSLGFKVEHWSRLPYLCEGDLDQAFYWLSDIVFVLTKK